MTSTTNEAHIHGHAGDDEMKQFSYRAFFSRNLIAQTYRHPPDSLATPASKGALRD